MGSTSEPEPELIACGNWVGVYTAGFYGWIRVGVYVFRGYHSLIPSLRLFIPLIVIYTPPTLSDFLFPYVITYQFVELKTGFLFCLHFLFSW